MAESQNPADVFEALKQQLQGMKAPTSLAKPDNQNVAGKNAVPNGDQTPNLVKSTEGIEQHVEELIGEELAGATPIPSSNFDAADFATLSNVAGQSNQTVDEPANFGEADPYVAPEVLEHDKKTTTQEYSPPKTVDQILAKLSDYEDEGDGDDIVDLHATAREDASAQAKPEPAQNAPSHARVKVPTPTKNEVPSQAESGAQRPIFSIESDNGPLVERTQFQRKSIPVSVIGEPIPVVPAADQNGEAIFDVSDFSESKDCAIVPIQKSLAATESLEPATNESTEACSTEACSAEACSAGACSTDTCSITAACDKGDCENAACETESNCQNACQEPQGEQSPEAQKFESNQLFVADDGDVIQVDGNDGFDFIDLACFNVEDAKFRPNEILISSENDGKFQIRHTNIDRAVFANGVEVNLNDPGLANDQAK